MIRILIVDDHTVVRRGLRQIVNQETDMTVVGEAQNVQELFGLIREQPCDVVMMDISLPDKTGLEALKELKQERPRLPVLILSVYPEKLYGVLAYKLGASGYVSKDTAAEELVRAIRMAVAGGKYFGLSTREKLDQNPTPATARPLHDILSEREQQVLRMIAHGRSGKQIADELSLSLNTIRTYRTRILEKMNMQNDEELIIYAINHGLVG